MLKWISKLTGHSEERPVAKIIAKDHLQMRIMEDMRDCGHPGYLIEFWVHATDTCKWIMIGMVDDIDLPSVLELLQDAAQFIADKTGVRRLPVIPLWGRKYFVDGRLAELRNTENPGDRVELVMREDLE